MSDRAVVMAVAGYPSRAAAEQDFQAVCCARWGDRPAPIVAMVEKGADGLLTIGRQTTPERFGYGTAVLGGALTVLAAPLGILYLGQVVASEIAWAGVAAIVAHFWNNVPKAELRQMSDLLETTQAVLVVVALDHDHAEIKGLLTNASTAILSDVASADLEAEYSHAITDASTTGG